MTRRQHEQVRQCDGKRRYQNINEARYQAKLGRKRERTFIHAYYCKYCNAFHIGHTIRDEKLDN